MDYRNLNTKPAGIYRNGQEILDIFSPTYVGGSCSKSFIEVTSDYIGRPDLVSLAVYGDDSYADVICRFNGISNPFELNEGIMLYIPFKTDLPNLYLQTPETCEVVSDSDILTLPTETSFKKKRGEKHKPNELLEDEENFVRSEDLGLVFY